MLDELTVSKNKLVGLKQVSRACETGQLTKVFIAKDADQHLLNKLLGLVMKHEIEYEIAPSKKLLGKAAGICVEAACAAIVKENLS